MTGRKHGAPERSVGGPCGPLPCSRPQATAQVGEQTVVAGWLHPRAPAREHRAVRPLPALVAAGLAAAVLAACGSPSTASPDPTADASTPRIAAGTAPETTTAATGPPEDPQPAVTEPTAALTTTSAPTANSTTTTTTMTPDYRSSVAVIDEAVAARMTESWRTGCPVPLEELRLLTLTHWGFDGAVHSGELVVHADVADGVVQVFAALYAAQFPIERMELVDVYGADDDLSTMANNTSAFNCRAVTGGTRWSEHSYGTAIDVNPVQNPYVNDGSVLDPNAVPYLDRSLGAPGIIVEGDAVVQAFGSIGWSWGGRWSDPVDYQHFSLTGR